LIALTVALMIVSVPHVLEDFHYGDLLGIGIPVAAATAIVLAAYAIQIAGIILVVRGERLGAWLLGIAGAVWCIGALLVHGHDIVFANEGYRNGLISKILDVLIIFLGAAAAWLAIKLDMRPARI
jgi:hypothetical protein